MEKDQKFFFETICYSLRTIREKLYLIIILSFISLIISIIIHRNLNQEYEYKTTYLVNWSNYNFLPYYDDSKNNKKDHVNFELKNYISKNFKNENINIKTLDEVEVFYKEKKNIIEYEKIIYKILSEFEIFLLMFEINKNEKKQKIVREILENEKQFKIDYLSSQIDNNNKIIYNERQVRIDFLKSQIDNNNESKQIIIDRNLNQRNKFLQDNIDQSKYLTEQIQSQDNTLDKQIEKVSDNIEKLIEADNSLITQILIQNIVDSIKNSNLYQKERLLEQQLANISLTTELNILQNDRSSSRSVLEYELTNNNLKRELNLLLGNEIMTQVAQELSFKNNLLKEEIDLISKNSTYDKSLIELNLSNSIYLSKIENIKKNQNSSFYLNKKNTDILSFRDNFMWLKLFVLQFLIILILVLVFNSILKNYKIYLQSKDK